jgi:hypothetical protein
MAGRHPAAKATTPDRPLPFLDHIGDGFLDQRAQPREHLAAPVAQFLDPRVDQSGCRLGALRWVVLHAAQGNRNPISYNSSADWRLLAGQLLDSLSVGKYRNGDSQFSEPNGRDVRAVNGRARNLRVGGRPGGNGRARGFGCQLDNLKRSFACANHGRAPGPPLCVVAEQPLVAIGQALHTAGRSRKSHAWPQGQGRHCTQTLRARRKVEPIAKTSAPARPQSNERPSSTAHGFTRLRRPAARVAS